MKLKVLGDIIEVKYTHYETKSPIIYFNICIE